MKCDNCGREVKADAQFCSNCGHPVESGNDESLQLNRSDKGAYAASVLSLLIVLALMTYGIFVIIQRDMSVEKNVSSSDSSSDRFNYDLELTDEELVGNWKCTDRAAADFRDSNFGVEVVVLLSLNGDGYYTLDYSMTDTGVPAKSVSASGSYSTEDGYITFTPGDASVMKSYLKRHGQRPSFQYSTGKDSFTLQYENGKDILFTRVSE